MVLLIVDAQGLITNESLYKFELFVSRVKELIAQARERGIEVIYVRHDDGEGKPLTPGAEGYDIYDAFQPKGDELIFDKKVNSPFLGTGLLEYLKSKGETTIIVAGLQTDYCIDATVKCGFEHGFKMIVPAHANSTVDNQYMSAEMTYQYYNEFMWNGRYAQCVSFEETLELMSAE